MAPHFLRNLVRNKEQRQRTVSLFRTLRSLTGIQWAQFFVGYVVIISIFNPTFLPTRSTFFYSTLLINQAQLTFLLNFSWLAWTCDSIDLYSLSFVAGNQGQYIAKEFKKTPQQVVRSSFRTLFQ
jgi:SHS family lactate transporter-like MFS transporter